MNFMYGVTQGNGLVAQRIYMERFPSRILSDPQTFELLHTELSANRSFNDSMHDTGTVRYHIILSKEDAVLQGIEGPSKSSKTDGRALGGGGSHLLAQLGT